MSNSNANNEPPEEHTNHLPPPWLSSLPDEIVVRCLALVPRSYHRSLTWVSKDIRSLVRSPELNSLRSTLHKSSIYICFQKQYNASNVHWFTLRPNDETATTTGYHVLPNPTPFPPHKYGSLAVSVGSKIFFIGGGSRRPSTDLWILETQSGNITQGPSMSVARHVEEAAAGVMDGKIYVVGGRRFSYESSYKEIQIEIFDAKSETWELAGRENVYNIPRYIASVEGKFYMVDYEDTTVYNPRVSKGERLVQMVSERLLEGGRKETLTYMVYRLCVVDDVLYALFDRRGLMWFDTKLNLWRRLVGRDGNEMFIFRADAMAEYDGKLVVLYMWGGSEVDHTVNKNVQCMFLSVHRVGERICWTIDWSGIVASVPSSFSFLHCLAVSD